MNRIENHMTIEPVGKKIEPECPDCREPLGEDDRCFFCEAKDLEVDIELPPGMPLFYEKAVKKSCLKLTRRATYYPKSEAELLSQATEYAKEVLGAWGYKEAEVEVSLPT